MVMIRLKTVDVPLEATLIDRPSLFIVEQTENPSIANSTDRDNRRQLQRCASFSFGLVDAQILTNMGPTMATIYWHRYCTSGNESDQSSRTRSHPKFCDAAFIGGEHLAYHFKTQLVETGSAVTEP